MGNITFNGISTESLGLIVQFFPTYHFPEKEYETVHIPGRNGDLVINKGSYKNVERTYSLAKVYSGTSGFIASSNSIASWLHSADGYARLEDTYEPDYYRMAMYKSDGDLNNFYDTATVIDVTFECKPQRWLKSGENEYNTDWFSENPNPTNYDALPIFIFETEPNTETVITVNDTTMRLVSLSSTQSIKVVIDCENAECHSFDNTTLYNSKLTLSSGKFPVLKASTTNTITVTGATNVKVIPRWWTL